MNIVFLGSPGAGKGTQAARLAQEKNFVHLSTGDIFRAELKNNTPLGQQARSYMDKGELVPDSLVIDMVEQKLASLGDVPGVLLDGFPRTLEQARAMEGRIPVSLVIDIEVDKSEIVNRLSSRRFCPECGNTQPAKEGDACSKCGKDVIQRDDDKEEVILKRLSVYEEQTKPLIDYYKKQGKLSEVSGNRGVDEVYADVAELVENLS